jgi:hypothetical protein
MKFDHIFGNDLRTLMAEAEHGEPFAFVRFCDGEQAIMENKDIRTADGWKVGNEWMRKAMKEAFLADLPGYHRGIACPCCWPEGAAWFRGALINLDVTTYSNLFVNGNYDTALPWLRGLARNWCVVSSAWGSDIRVPADWSSIRDLDTYVSSTVIRMLSQRRPMLVAAGPLGKVLIHKCWEGSHVQRTILDIGSALDPDFFGKGNRGYHDPNHPNRKKICVWDSQTRTTHLTNPTSTPQIVIRDVPLPG